MRINDRGVGDRLRRRPVGGRVTAPHRQALVNEHDLGNRLRIGQVILAHGHIGVGSLRHAQLIAGHGRVNGGLERGITGRCTIALPVRRDVVRGG